MKKRSRNNQSTTPETEEEKNLPHMVDDLVLDSIRIDPSLQIRVREDPKKIQEYAEKMKRGVTFRPCVVFSDGAFLFWMADGIHRYKAARIANQEKLTCEIRVGTRRDALRYALGANEDHGVHRTRADRRNAIKIALEDEEWGSLGPNALAELCNVSPQLVEEVRAEQNEGQPEAKFFVGADGKRYPKRNRRTTEQKRISGEQKQAKTPDYKQLTEDSVPNSVTFQNWNVADSDTQGRSAKFIKAEAELTALAKEKGQFHILFLDLTALPEEVGPHRSEELSFLYRLQHQAIFAPGAVLYAMGNGKTLPVILDLFLSWGFAYYPSPVAWCRPGEPTKSMMLQKILLVGTRGESMAPTKYANPFMQALPFEVGPLLGVLGQNFPDWERRLALYGPRVDGWSSWRWS